jgi:group I intron endonuclease
MQLYQLLFPNGKSYIGITRLTAEKRFIRHCESGSTMRACQYAIRKYGKENVIINVLATVDNWELLCLAEIEAIEKFNTKHPNGYNLTDGGESSIGFKHSEESRKRMSESGKKKILTPEHKQKLIDYNKNRVLSQETRDKMSKSSKGRKLSDSHRAILVSVNTGTKKSQETRDKISAKAKGRKIPDTLKSVLSIKSRAVNRKNKNGFTGVCKTKGGRFQAKCRVLGKAKFLGTYNTPEEASEAYQKFVATLPC